MAKRKLSSLRVILLTCFILDSFWKIFQLVYTFGENKFLIVGIMSAQGHFKLRESIRNTWAKLIDHQLIDFKFLIGNRTCPVPPADRISPYICEKWHNNVPQVSNLSTAMVENISNKSFEGFPGFTFIIRYNITVVKLGVHPAFFRNGEHTKVRVILLNAALGTKVASATFISDNYTDKDFIWKTIQAVQLPNNFEGELKVITDKNISINCSSNIQNIGVVHIFELSKNDKFIKFKTKSCLLVAFHYLIENKDILKNFNYKNSKNIRQIKWNEEMEKLQYQLEIENRAYQDILFINTIDVYNNLKVKLFEFLKWSERKRYKYILKTDDDVFLDVERIVSTLMRHASEDWDWWSCFRQGYKPPNYGKWRDRLFNREHYPLFPSGAGYIITEKVAKSIVSKIDIKRVGAAGEDVSLGFWINNSLGYVPKSLNTTWANWACGTQCSKKYPCNVPELNWTSMYRIMNCLTSSKPIC